MSTWLRSTRVPGSRRHPRLLTTGPLLVVLVLLLAQAAGCGSSTRPASSHGTHPAPVRTTSAPRPSVLVVVTSQGVVETLNPTTGTVIRTLATGATGDEVALTPSGSDVYFEAATGCEHEIDKVPVSGGATTLVGTGSLPSLSPDGLQLAYVRQPFVASQACQQPQLSPSGFAVVVRTLSSGTETTFPLSPQVAADGLPYPVDHLSWSWNSKDLAVSIAAPEDNEGWQLVVIDPATNLYYFSGSGVAVTGNNPTASYYREGVFLPDGNLFVDRVCCAGIPVNVTSNLLLEVAPSTGVVVDQVAIGILANDHTSLVSDRSGHWLLYLSAGHLYISDNGARPTSLVSGLVAADWN